MRTAFSPEAMTVRACTCTFCRRHGGRTVTDSAGEVVLRVDDPSLLSRYSFGLKTAEFFVCKECGVYVAMVMTDGERSWATVNLNALNEAKRFGQPAFPVSYDGETAHERISRRKLQWTPARVEMGARRG